MKFKKILPKIFVIMLIVLPISTLLYNAAISKVNLDVERLKKQVQIKNDAIECMKMNIDELKSIANLQSVIINEGLSYNSGKIKVINQ